MFLKSFWFMKCQNVTISVPHHPLCCPRWFLAPTSGSAAVGGPTVPVAGSAVQGVQTFLQAQKGGAHLLQDKHHLLRGCAWRRRTVGRRPARPFSQPNVTHVGGMGARGPPRPSALPAPFRPQAKARGHLPQQHGLYLLQQWNQGPPGAWRGQPGTASAQSPRPWPR